MYIKYLKRQKRVFVLLLLLTKLTLAQTKLTVLPNTNSNNSFEFYIPKLEDISFSESVFKRYVEQNINLRDIALNYKVMVLDENKKNDSEKSSRIKKSDTIGFFGVNIKELINKNNEKLYVETKLMTKKSNISFYDYTKAKDKKKYYAIPKLLLGYESSYYNTSDKAQTGYTPQNNNYYDWSFSSGFKKLKEKQSYTNQKEGIQILLYKNKPLLVNNISNKIEYLNESGKEIWGMDTNEGPVVTPVIDHNDKLYYYSNKNLKVYDLKTHTNIKTKSLKDVFMHYESSNTNLKQEITLGYDGTQYVTTNNGIEVISAYPSLKNRWFYPAGKNHNLGQISLSDDETLVFVIDVDIIKEDSQLLILSADDGHVLFRSSQKHTSYKNGVNSLIPAPVIYQKDDNNTMVYLLNGNTTSNKLYFYEVTHTNRINNILTKKTNDIDVKITDSIIAKDSVNGGISNPVISKDGELFFIKDNKLTHYTTEGKLKSVDDNHKLSESSTLLIDKDNCIHVLSSTINSTNETKKLIGYKFTNKAVFKLQYHYDLSKYKGLSGELTLAQNGNLFLKTNTNKITCLSPVAFHSDGYKKQYESLEEKTTYVHNDEIILKKQEVNSKSRLNLISKKFTIQKDFKVKKGAELHFKTLTGN